MSNKYHHHPKCPVRSICFKNDHPTSCSNTRILMKWHNQTPYVVLYATSFCRRWARWNSPKMPSFVNLSRQMMICKPCMKTANAGISCTAVKWSFSKPYIISHDFVLFSNSSNSRTSGTDSLWLPYFRQRLILTKMSIAATIWGENIHVEDIPSYMRFLACWSISR